MNHGEMRNDLSDLRTAAPANVALRGNLLAGPPHGSPRVPVVLPLGCADVGSPWVDEIMNETYITGQVMKRAKGILRGAVVLKHCDKATSAIPDVSISYLGPTAWIEMKYLRKGEKLKKIIDMDQLIMCNELATTTDGRCWIVVYEEHPRRTSIWIPQVMFRNFYPHLAVGPWKTIYTDAVDTAWTPEKPLGLLATIQACGAIRVPDWPYDVVAHLVKQAAQ